MPKFIPTDEGWINLTHVASVRLRQYKGEKPFLTFAAPDGSSMGCLTDPQQDIEALLAEVWPAAQGTVALVIWTYCNATPNGRPDTVRSQSQPIAGWRLTYGTPLPVLLEEACGNARVFIELPGGCYLEQEGATYADVADAEANVLADDQADWDRQHAKADDTGRGQQ